MGLISAVKNATHSSSHARASEATYAAPNETVPTAGVNTASTPINSVDRTATAGASGAKEYCYTQNAPVVQENLRERQEVHITPIVDREREETIVKQTIQPVVDRVQAETVHHHTQAEGIARETSEELSADYAQKYQSQREIVSGGRTVERINEGVVENAPVIKERVNTHVIEEIQPVIERTIDETHVVHTAQPIYEHHTAAPIVEDVRTNAPISLSEFESRGGSLSGVPLQCERR